MGLRFRKKINIAPGLSLNLSKSGASLSMGGRGVTTNFSSRGVRSTFSIPGTGLSYVTPYYGGKRGRRLAADRPSAPPVNLKAAKRAELQRLKSQATDQFERLIATGEQVIAQCADRADAVLLNRSLADVRSLFAAYKFAVEREDFEMAGKALSMCGEDLSFTREVNEYLRAGHCSDPAAEDPAVLHADLRKDQGAEQAQRQKSTIAKFEADYAPLVDKIPLLGSRQRLSLQYFTDKVRAELECAKVFADRSVSRGLWFLTKARELVDEQQKLFFQFCRDKGIRKEKPEAPQPTSVSGNVVTITSEHQIEEKKRGPFSNSLFGSFLQWLRSPLPSRVA